MTPTESRNGRILHSPLQAPEHDDDPIDADGPVRIRTDAWGVVEQVNQGKGEDHLSNSNGGDGDD